MMRDDEPTDEIVDSDISPAKARKPYQPPQLVRLGFFFRSAGAAGPMAVVFPIASAQPIDRAVTQRLRSNRTPRG